MFFDTFCVLKDSLLKVTNPPFCVYCSTWLKQPIILCDKCTLLIQPIVSTTVPITAQKSMVVYALSPYQDPLKTLVLGKTKSLVLASRQLGELLCQLAPLELLSFDYCIPIPLHWTRYAYRGYNQAEIMANVIARRHNKEIVALLKRNKRTIFQSRLSLADRADNLEDAFTIRRSCDVTLFYKKHLLLVDDLMTTGSTLKAAARELLMLKPASITAIVACRTL